MRVPATLISMSDDLHLPPSNPHDVVDQLVAELLPCGGVLSQIISRMFEFSLSGRTAPDAAPIPEIAHSLIRSVLGDVGKRHSKRDLKVAARIVREATDAMCREIVSVDSELLPDTIGVIDPMDSTEEIKDFVLALLGSASTLPGMVTNLADVLPDDAYPDEDNNDVAREMLYGSIVSVLASVDPSEIRRATELIQWATTRVIEHLQLACALSRRMDSDAGGLGPMYG
jgi:hypothetical protein